MSKILIAEPVLGEEEFEALRQPLETGWVTQGPRVAQFEEVFAERHHVGHAIATTSCTTAMHLALAGLGIGPGDDVIVPAFTWVATANVCRHVGARPVFVDVEPRSFNIDPARVAEAVTERTKAVIPVHLFGLCADVDEVRAAVPKGVAIIEDAACAVGARYRGGNGEEGFAGTLGDVAAFSFHPRKIITTGEGGMITTNDARLSKRIKELRNHGAAIPEEVRHHSAKPHHFPAFDQVGFNFRMTDLQGALGVVQMGRLDALLEERQHRAAWYRDRLSALDWLVQPEQPAGGLHAYQSYVCVVDEERAPATRDAIMDRLYEQGISTRPGSHAPALLGAYGRKAEEFEVAARLARTTLALPLHNKMGEADYERVATALERL